MKQLRYHWHEFESCKVAYLSNADYKIVIEFVKHRSIDFNINAINTLPRRQLRQKFIELQNWLPLTLNSSQVVPDFELYRKLANWQEARKGWQGYKDAMRNLITTQGMTCHTNRSGDLIARYERG